MSQKALSPRSHSVAGAFVFLLLALFALLATVMVLFSAKLYRSTVEQTSAHSALRVMNSYVRNTLHANDRAGAVSIRQESGMDVLTLSGPDGAYETLVYCSGGEIREQLSDAGEPFNPELGEAICAAQRLEAHLEGRLLTLAITEPDGQINEISVALSCPSGKEAAQ